MVAGRPRWITTANIEHINQPTQRIDLSLDQLYFEGTPQAVVQTTVSAMTAAEMMIIIDLSADTRVAVGDKIRHASCPRVRCGALLAPQRVPITPKLAATHRALDKA